MNLLVIPEKYDIVAQRQDFSAMFLAESV